MMQIDDILDDLKTRKANLTKIKKEISADKTKSGILDFITTLIGHNVNPWSRRRPVSTASEGTWRNSPRTSIP